MVPCGTVAGHVVGYWLAGQHAGLNGDHSHLRSTAWFSSLAAVATLLIVGVRPRLGRARLPVAWLVGGQLGMFIGLEAAEHVGAGRDVTGLLSSPTLRWGLVAQLLTAGLLVGASRLAEVSGQRVRALLSGRARPGLSTSRRSTPARRGDPLRSSMLAWSASERGPPRSLVPV